MQDKIERTIGKSVYEVAVLVKDSGGENGPGHVSLTFIKSKGELLAPVKKSHTSFFPGALGSLLTGISLGSVPVLGQIERDPAPDLDEATHVLMKQISRKQFKRGTATAARFHQDVESGRSMYAVFGTANPLSLFISGFLPRYTSVDDNGFSGVLPDSTQIKAPDVLNCASSVTKVLREAGITRFDNPVIPTFFSAELQTEGFEIVPKDKIAHKFK